MLTAVMLVEILHLSQFGRRYASNPYSDTLHGCQTDGDGTTQCVDFLFDSNGIRCAGYDTRRDTCYVTAPIISPIAVPLVAPQTEGQSMTALSGTPFPSGSPVQA